MALKTGLGILIVLNIALIYNYLQARKQSKNAIYDFYFYFSWGSPIPIVLMAHAAIVLDIVLGIVILGYGIGKLL